jgi:hypothetical protein
MSKREKGVATVPCPNCGTELPGVEQADGSITGSACPECYPAAESEKASKAKTTPARETGTTPKEK